MEIVYALEWNQSRYLESTLFVVKCRPNENISKFACTAHTVRLLILYFLVLKMRSSIRVMRFKDKLVDSLPWKLSILYDCISKLMWRCVSVACETWMALSTFIHFTHEVGNSYFVSVFHLYFVFSCSLIINIAESLTIHETRKMDTHTHTHTTSAAAFCFHK